MSGSAESSFKHRCCILELSSLELLELVVTWVIWVKDAVGRTQTPESKKKSSLRSSFTAQSDKSLKEMRNVYWRVRVENENPTHWNPERANQQLVKPKPLLPKSWWWDKGSKLQLNDDREKYLNRDSMSKSLGNTNSRRAPRVKHPLSDALMNIRSFPACTKQTDAPTSSVLSFWLSSIIHRCKFEGRPNFDVIKDILVVN